MKRYVKTSNIWYTNRKYQHFWGVKIIHHMLCVYHILAGVMRSSISVSSYEIIFLF
jgi:hypothetical protein